MTSRFLNPLLLTDGYKTGHHWMYVKGTSLVYANFTPRSNKHALPECTRLVSFGQQMTIIQIHELFENDFFSRPKHEVCGEMKREMSMYLNTDYDVSHFEALHDLGYLPIKVKVIEEGTLVPMRVPVLTIVNTHPEFFWITNYLETIISNLLWKPMTSASIAHAYRNLFTEWQEKTDSANKQFVDWQAHDFSMRGLDSVEATISSGLGHLTSFSGSDSLPAIFGARKYYNETGFVAGSVNATEHSVMCAGSKKSEFDTFKTLITSTTGILSIVSDTWDLWKVLTEYLPALKDIILARDGKVVIRPDSGDPVDIICGRQVQMSHGIKVQRPPEVKGVIELLWETFGGTINEQGYKVLNPHIGAIYGDSITLDRARQIFTRLEEKGFASTNIVLGVGSFTYQYNTRDSFGFAMKATYIEVDGEGREIFKDPVTDDGVKRSAKGLLKVVHNGIDYELVDQQTWAEEAKGVMIVIYENGKFENQITLAKIRTKLK